MRSQSYVPRSAWAAATKALDSRVTRPTLPNPATHEHAYRLLPAQVWARSPLHDSQASCLGGDGLLRVSLALGVDSRKGTPCDLPRAEPMQQILLKWHGPWP
jgi:hypothetical protein